MKEIIQHFFKYFSQSPFELYNESGFRHELGIFLKKYYPELNVKLDYPVSRMFNPIPKLANKEADIFIIESGVQKHVIELKMPKDENASHVDLYRVIQDLKFLEQLKDQGFETCTEVFITKRKNIWESINGGIYKLFAGDSVNLRSVTKDEIQPFLIHGGPIELGSTYKAKWEVINDAKGDEYRYFMINVK
ncbi:MAG TPA: hypothetical protein PK605_07555 [Ignavibacteria bacterium]|nr:hypothetical protein [Ignavibacteria bacterium]HAX48389.1 hypothetical protein [Bacteroidota bacterium]HRF65366.1 hypothetical protein [Ignavibacteria bacterium]HRJ04243.1 hypothetical protein [Ignavibacteria bacterium]HRJ86029.1 hypothetical protein [Ignavibacteria bacterium]